MLEAPAVIEVGPRRSLKGLFRNLTHSLKVYYSDDKKSLLEYFEITKTETNEVA